MADQRDGGLSVYSIAAHRGFADALVAGLVPRYREEGFGLARLTLLVLRLERLLGSSVSVWLRLRWQRLRG